MAWSCEGSVLDMCSFGLLLVDSCRFVLVEAVTLLYASQALWFLGYVFGVKTAA